MKSNLFKVVLFLYLSVFASTARFLLSCNAQDALHNNVFYKHLLMFIFIFFSISYTGSTEVKQYYSFHMFLLRAFVFTIAVYVLFMFMTRMSMPFLLVSILILCAHLIVQDYHDENKDETHARAFWITLIVLRVLFGIVVFLGVSHYVWTGRIIQFRSFFSTDCNLNQRSFIQKKDEQTPIALS